MVKKTLIIVVQTILEKIITEFPSKLVYDLLRELSEMIGSSATLVQVWPSSVKKWLRIVISDHYLEN